MSELTIAPIPIGDWHEETMRAEMLIANEADILKAIDAGVPTGQIARAAIVCRELGQADPDTLRPNKLLLYSGARENVSVIVRKAQHPVAGTNGREYMAPDYVGPLQRQEAAEEDDAGARFQTVADLVAPTTYVKSTDPVARQNAEDYILNVVPGHIWNRLLTVKEHGGDLPGLVQRFKEKLDEMLVRLA